jgi:hypothetical protein
MQQTVFQTAGPLIITEVEVGSFDRILVNRDIEVILKTSPNYKVVVQTGENLLNDIDISVVDNQLELTDYNTCNFVRDYGITKIYIEAPDIKGNKIIIAIHSKLRRCIVLSRFNPIFREL